MKTLIISQSQMRRLDEAVMSVDDENDARTGDYDVPVTYSQPGRNGNPMTVTNDELNNKGELPYGTQIALDNAKTVVVNPSDENISESTSFKKSDIKKIQKNKGQKFTKEEFRKKLKEEYGDFEIKLKNKKEQYGK